MDQRETESGCSVLEEVAVLATGPEPAAFTCEPIGLRLVERPVVAPSAPSAPTPTVVEVAAPIVVEPPSPTVVEVEPPTTPYYAVDDDDLDLDDAVDEVAQRPARVDPRLTDPDTLERAKRVEVYRAMIEQDPNSSIFTRTNSPPRRVLPAPRTL